MQLRVLRYLESHRAGRRERGRGPVCNFAVDPRPPIQTFGGMFRGGNKLCSPSAEISGSEIFTLG